ncbi:MAG: site-specific integrase [Gaiellaceae bacterium]|jgi:integrase
MASLQARHKQGKKPCPCGRPWTTFADAAECGCSPTYFVVVREGEKLHRERVGKNRRDAQRALTQLQGKVDRGEYAPLREIRFDAFADEWEKGLELKSSTRKSYKGTIKLAKVAFRGRTVRSIRSDDVLRFLAGLRGQVSDSTRHKHMRNLSVLFSAAVRRGYAGRNPAKDLDSSERPKRDKAEAAWFEQAELAQLFGAIDDAEDRALFETALKTGARLGELSALTWRDVRLSDAVFSIERTYTNGVLGAPKSETSRRRVDFTPDVAQVLANQWARLGKPGDDTLVFPGHSRSGYLNAKIVRAHLYGAMQRAGVPRAGEAGTLRTFHSFRHTYAKRALESGRPLFWLSRHLGHSSMAVTEHVYGHWSREEAKREVAEMVGVFGV